MIYFLSDAHLGSLVANNSRQQEKHLVALLDKMKQDATAIYLLGDIFDFWYEYKTVVPKGFVRFMGKIAEITDSGIEVHFFIGNHDLWTFGYLQEELGMQVHYKPEKITLGNKHFFLAHGDGLYDNAKGFKLIRKIFHNQYCQKAFRWLHPDIGVRIGLNWSKSSRKNPNAPKEYLGEYKEHLVLFAKDYTQKNNDIDLFIFGHRHIELDLQLKNRSRVIILGDFIQFFTYGIFDGENFRLENFELENNKQT